MAFEFESSRFGLPIEYLLIFGFKAMQNYEKRFE